ncbi:MAG: endonuclease/exonuclease/phosphatase family protein [Bacteroidaceae bacterium]|nr:endonuclease/exonuclease/phosphatase family protein [Bacteroidaceae bacterium]
MIKRLSLIVCCALLSLTSTAQEGRVAMYSIGFYNLENLFDTQHDEGKNDYEFLPDGANKWSDMKYQHKLKNLARVLSEMGTDRIPSGCAAIGVSEVENAHCLSDLCAQEPLAARGFKFCHIEGPDQRGVDCGLLYNPSFFHPAKVWLQPYVLKNRDARPTRGFLTVQGTLAGDSVTIIVCHWPSRFTGKQARVWAGQQVKAEKDSIVRANPQMKILIMGDMNDDPFDESMAKGLGARRKLADVKTPMDLFNPWWQILLDGKGTLKYDGKWNLFDQIVMSHSLTRGTKVKDYTSLTFYKAEIFRRDYLFQDSGRYKGSPLRTHASGVWLDGYSDHLPVVTYHVKRVGI